MVEDANSEPPTDAFQFVKFDNDKAGYLELEFEKGIPVAVERPTHEDYKLDRLR